VGGGSLADWTTGEDRKTEGDGILMVSILSQPFVETLKPTLRAGSQGKRRFEDKESCVVMQLGGGR